MSVYNNNSIGNGYYMLSEPLVPLRDIVNQLETKLNDEVFAKDRDNLQQKGYTTLSSFLKDHKGTKSFIQGLIDNGLHYFLFINYDLLLGHISKLTKEEMKEIIDSLPESSRRDGLKDSLALAISFQFILPFAVDNSREGSDVSYIDHSRDSYRSEMPTLKAELKIMKGLQPRVKDKRTSNVKIPKLSSKGTISRTVVPKVRVNPKKKSQDEWKNSQNRTIQLIIGLLPPDQQEEQRRQLRLVEENGRVQCRPQTELSRALQRINFSQVKHQKDKGGSYERS